jgi:hypothetical protein
MPVFFGWHAIYTAIAIIVLLDASLCVTLWLSAQTDRLVALLPRSNIVGLVEPLLDGLSPEPMQFTAQEPGGVEFRGNGKRFTSAPAIDPMHERTHVLIAPELVLVIASMSSLASSSK